MNNVFMISNNELPEYVYKRWNSIDNNLNLQIFLQNSLDSYANNNFEPYFQEVIKHIKPVNKKFLFGLLCLYYNGGIYINPNYYPDISPSIIFENNKSDCFFVLKNYNNNLEKNFFAAREKFNPFILALITNICNKHYFPKKSFDTYINLLNKILPRSIKLKNNKKIPVTFHKSFFIHDKFSKKNAQMNKFPINLKHYKDIKVRVLQNTFNAKFKTMIRSNKLIIQRLDKETGWEFDLNLEISLKKKINVEFLYSKDDDYTKVYSIFLKEEKLFNEKYSSTDIYDILNPIEYSDNETEEEIESESEPEPEPEYISEKSNNDLFEQTNDENLNTIKNVLLNVINKIITNDNKKTAEIVKKEVEDIKEKSISYKIYSKDKILYNSNKENKNNIEIVISEKINNNIKREICSAILITGNFFDCYSNNIFKNCIKKIISTRKKVIIIIHTWLLSQTKIVNNKIIEKYFGKEISQYIEHIEINNYNEIKKKYKLPNEMKSLSFLKNRWYTTNIVTKLLTIIDKNFDMIININFNTFNKISSWKLGINQKNINKFIKNNIYDDKIILFNNTIQDGISNFYTGSYNAIKMLHNTLDKQFMVIYNIFNKAEIPDEVFFHVVNKINNDLFNKQKNDFFRKL